MTALLDDLQVAAEVVGRLRALGIDAIVVGSAASSLYGEPRMTRDVDLLAVIQPQDVQAIVAALQDEFYVAEEAVAEAVAHASCFNAIHLASVFKIDVFVAAPGSREAAELTRARAFPASGNLRFAAPEDVLTGKLAWFRLGGEVSDQQWRDILGILRHQGTALDLPTLHRLAAEAGVTELLHRALAANAARR